MFGMVSRAKYERERSIANIFQAMSKSALGLLKEEQAERIRLTNVIINMRKEGFNLRPEDTDERWPGGSYVMDEVEAEKLEATTEEEATIAQEVELAIAEDFRRVFGQED